MSKRIAKLATMLAASAAAFTPILSLDTPKATAAENAAENMTPATCHLGVIKSLRTGVPANTIAVNYNQSSGEIYVGGQNKSGQWGVEAINGTTYKPTAFIPTGGRFPYGIAVNPGTNTIYVANDDTSTLSVINGSTNKLTATIHVARTAFSVDVDRRDGKVYVTGLAGDISIISSATNKIVGTIHLGRTINHAALNQVTGLLYATGEQSPGHPGVIFVVNVRTRKIIARIKPGGGSRPYAVAVNPRTNTVYVTSNPNPGHWGVIVINGATNQVTTEISTSLYPGFLSLNPRNNLVYVITGTAENNAIMEIDGRDNELISTLSIDTFDSIFTGVNAPARYIYATSEDGTLLVLAGCR
ncbi:MAG TPA: YncE family protein [Streptosporangiaceae bacterium]|nr:YncE family protein [Streptosporangiaceae bacterium]